MGGDRFDVVKGQAPPGAVAAKRDYLSGSTQPAYVSSDNQNMDRAREHDTLTLILFGATLASVLGYREIAENLVRLAGRCLEAEARLLEVTGEMPGA
jgi:hypothetical protein